jgi:DNA-binding transcriptional ArsR family regulator
MSDPMIEEVSGIFHALSDPSRLKILRSLLESKKPLSQGQVAEVAGLSQANASKHLALLVRERLVLRSPDGNTVFFSPVSPLVPQVCDLMCGHVTQRIKLAYQSIK